MKHFRRLLSGLLATTMVIVAVPMFSVSAAAEESTKKWASTFSELVDDIGFVNGINISWFSSESYGQDIGRNALKNYSTSLFDMSLVETTLTNCKAAGYDAIKLWLTENQEGILFDEDGKVVGVEPVFKENLAKIYKLAEELGLYVNICINPHDESLGTKTSGNDKSIWDKYRQYVYREEQTQYYLDNWLTPIIEMTKEHPNVLLVDVYCEPEAEGGYWLVGVGTTWERMRSFLKAVATRVKEVNPKLETYSSAAQPALVQGGKYDDLNLDYYGMDFYTANGVVHDPKDMFTSRPTLYGEIGLGDGLTNTEERFSFFCESYLNDCVDKGVKAAFFWCYGTGENSIRSITDGAGRMRSGILTPYFWALDRKYERTEYDGMDAPTMMYSTASAIRFFGSREAVSYRLERSTDKKNWTTIKTFSSDGDEQYEAYMYDVSDETAVAENTYYYRAVAIDEEGNEMPAEPTRPIYVARVECDESENLIKDYSFEKGLVDDAGRDGWHIDQGNQQYPAVYITDGTPGEDVHSGKAGYFQGYRHWQQLTLEANTDYTFTFWFKATGAGGQDPASMAYWYFGINLLTTWDVSGAELTASCNGIRMNGPGVAATNQILLPNRYKDGDWHCLSYTFNSGSYTDVRLQFFQYNIISRLDWYLDDVYLFKSSKN